MPILCILRSLPTLPVLLFDVGRVVCSFCCGRRCFRSRNHLYYTTFEGGWWFVCERYWWVVGPVAGVRRVSLLFSLADSVSRYMGKVGLLDDEVGRTACVVCFAQTVWAVGSVLGCMGEMVRRIAPYSGCQSSLVRARLISVRSWSTLNGL